MHKIKQGQVFCTLLTRVLCIKESSHNKIAFCYPCSKVTPRFCLVPRSLPVFALFQGHSRFLPCSKVTPRFCPVPRSLPDFALFQGHSRILPCSKVTPGFCLVPRSLPDFILQPIFLLGCKIKSGSGLGMRLAFWYMQTTTHTCTCTHTHRRQYRFLLNSQSSNLYTHFTGTLNWTCLEPRGEYTITSYMLYTLYFKYYC